MVLLSSMEQNSIKQEDHVPTDVIRFFEQDQFAAMIGAKLQEASPGYAKATMNITVQHLNAANVVQGGAIFTLADFALGAAANSYGQVALGVNANISYFQAPQGDMLTAEAKEVSVNKKLASYCVDVTDNLGNLVARMTGMVYRKRDKIDI